MDEYSSRLSSRGAAAAPPKPAGNSPPPSRSWSIASISAGVWPPGPASASADCGCCCAPVVVVRGLEDSATEGSQAERQSGHELDWEGKGQRAHVSSEAREQDAGSRATHLAQPAGGVSPAQQVPAGLADADDAEVLGRDGGRVEREVVLLLVEQDAEGRLADGAYVL